MHTTSLKTTLLGAALATISLLSALPAAAQNLLSDGTFDTGIAGFVSVKDGETIKRYDALDLDEDPESGSLEIADAGNDSELAAFAKRCVDGDLPAGEYYFEYWSRLATGEAANGSANAFVALYDVSDCDASPASYVLVAGFPHKPVTGRGLWFRFRAGDITQGTTIPAGIKSFAIFVQVKRTTGSILTVNVDNFFFAPVGKPLCKGHVPTIGGSDGDDAIFGTDGPDVIVTFGGDDYVFAGGGADLVCAGEGDDTVSGEEGPDDLFGQGGNDTLLGDEGNDLMKGGPGDDTLGGGTEKDVCIGGGGSDLAYASCEKVRGVP